MSSPVRWCTLGPAGPLAALSLVPQEDTWTSRQDRARAERAAQFCAPQSYPEVELQCRALSGNTKGRTQAGRTWAPRQPAPGWTPPRAKPSALTCGKSPSRVPPSAEGRRLNREGLTNVLEALYTRAPNTPPRRPLEATPRESPPTTEVAGL